MKNLMILCVLLIGFSAFGQEIPQADISSVINGLTLKQTTAEEPVSMGAALVKSSNSDSEIAKLVVKAVIHNNWHIYAYVPEGGYFIQSEVTINCPDGTRVNLVKEPKVHNYQADPNIMLYKGELIFVYDIIGELEEGEYSFKATLSFQACDAYHCYPPNDLSKELILKVN